MYNVGYYGSKKYSHHPDSEKQLFTDVLLDYIKKTNHPITGIEIGVLYGDTSKFLLNINEKIFLTGIDPLIPDSMNQHLVGNMDRIINNTIEFGNRFTLINDYSYNVVDNILDNIDFLFIDGSHHYGDVKSDYELFSPKIKYSGLIFFHDSRMNRGGAEFHVGSSKFVDEIIGNDKSLELIGEAFSLTCFIKK